MADVSKHLVLRDRLLTELVEPSSSSAPSASLIAASDDEAELILSGGERCWLLTANDEAESIGRRAGAIIAAHRGRPIVLVAVGGDSRVAAALKAAVPFFQLGRIGAFQLDENGRFRKVSGRKSP